MIRLSTEDGAALCQLLNLVREFEEDGDSRWSEPDERLDSLTQFLERETGHGNALQLTYDMLYKLLGSDGLISEGEVPLIDAIEHILSNNGARNVLTGQTLENLRKALWQPSERSNTVAKLRLREMGCSTCAHRFEPGEVVTFTIQRNEPSFVCTACLQPTLVSCSMPGCMEHLKGPSALSKRRMCRVHGGSEGGLEEASPFGGAQVSPGLAEEQAAAAARLWGATRVVVRTPTGVTSGGAPTPSGRIDHDQVRRWATELEDIDPPLGRRR